MKSMVWIIGFMLAGIVAMGGEKRDSLKVGDKAPDFNAMNVYGDIVSVKDFRGKYVYIDVWATWCEPCLMEVPFLKELEKKFRGRKIVFVSISTEKNRGKWTEMVRIKEMTGVQLSTGGDRSFSDALRVEGIPRFILLDKKGRILDMHMTRPSNPDTEKRLRGLKGI